ncbi:interleukin-6 receptor subunit alpha [Diretmus argenteus]
MRMFLPLLCVCALCVLQVRGFLEGTCPRKDPPPGVLVLSRGNKLTLTCCGQAKVNGVKVDMTRDSSSTNRATPDSVGGQETVTESEDKALEGTGPFRYTDAEHEARPMPSYQPTMSSLKMDDDDDYELEEGNRVTRGLRTRPQWKRNGRMLEEGSRGWGGVLFERHGTALSLTSVREADSGMYSCHRRGKMLFSLKVIVADPPERPVLSCYKKSPSSKIRCEWPLQKPATVRPHCYLFLNKGHSRTFSRSECSYSRQLSRCWCALDHNEDEDRLRHTAYLCVTSTAGNSTSALLDFTPLSILKPDPPSAVAVHQEEGQERRLRVTWSFPYSWKIQDRYFQLLYELSYRPNSSLGPQGTQKQVIKDRSYIITDALPGVEYLIQLRTKDEYDGLWSDWSTPVNGSSWTGSSVLLSDDLSATMYPFDVEEGSADPDTAFDVVLGLYIYRHKERLMPKLQSLNVISQCSDSRPPAAAAPTPQEGQALVTFAPLRYKEPLPNEVEEEEEENKEEEKAEGKTEAMHFNNTSYFLVQKE